MKSEDKTIVILTSSRHKNFITLLEDTVKDITDKCKDIKFTILVEKEINEENIKKADIVVVPSYFSELIESKRYVYVKINYPTDRDERSKILKTMEENYMFYIDYLNRNGYIIYEEVVEKEETERVINMIKSTHIFKPNDKLSFVDRLKICILYVALRNPKLYETNDNEENNNEEEYLPLE